MKEACGDWELKIRLPDKALKQSCENSCHEIQKIRLVTHALYYTESRTTEHAVL